MTESASRPICVICLENLTDDCEALPCGHVFHATCWRQNPKPECATCRHPINESESEPVAQSLNEYICSICGRRATNIKFRCGYHKRVAFDHDEFAAAIRLT